MDENTYKEHQAYIHGRIKHFENLIKRTTDESTIRKFKFIVEEYIKELNTLKLEYPEYEI